MYAGLTTADKPALLALQALEVQECTYKGMRINISLALAQIAEMESAEEPLTNRDKWMQLWNESDEILARKFVEQEWFGTLWCVYMFSEEPISRHEKYEDAIQAAIIALNSPYTEGETK